MRIFSLLAVAGLATLGFYLAPERIQDQVRALGGFVGASAGRVFEVAGDMITGDEGAQDESEKTAEDKKDLHIDELILELETNLRAIKSGALTPEMRTAIVTESEEIIGVLKEETKKSSGPVGTIIAAVANRISGDSCKPE